MATELDTKSFLSLADLTNLPFADESLSVILNIFTPSNYAEFHRVLTENGRVIKIIPDRNYLLLPYRRHHCRFRASLPEYWQHHYH